MTEKEFDVLIKHAAPYLRRDNIHQKSFTFQPSASYCRWERELLRDPFGKKARCPLSWYRWTNIATRRITRAACILLCIATILFSAWLLTPPQVRATVWGVIMEWLPGNAAFSGSHDATDEYVPSVYYQPSYIPNGFDLTEIWDPFEDGSVFRMTYKKATGEQIIFKSTFASNGNETGIDNEQGSYYTALINGGVAHVFERNEVPGMHSIVWTDNQTDYVFVLHVDNSLTIQEAISIAESVSQK